MTSLVSAALFWGGCIFWLSVAGLVVWVAANELSSRRSARRFVESGNRFKAGRVPEHDPKRAYSTFSTIEGRRRSRSDLAKRDLIAKYGRRNPEC